LPSFLFSAIRDSTLQFGAQNAANRGGSVMDIKQANRNVVLYYFFQLLREPLFWGPILISYIRHVSQMSLSEIYIMEATCLIGIMLLEIPSGALADLLGRRRTIFIGSALIIAEHLVFALADSRLMIWSANLIWVVGMSLVSGADSSLLFDSLRVLNREDDFRRIEGQSVSFRLLLVAACSPLVGYMASWNWRLPVGLGVVFIAINCLVTYFFAEPPFAGRQKYTAAGHWRLMKLSVLFVSNHRPVKWVIAFSVLVGVISKVWFFTYNPYFELVNLPLSWYGWIFFGLNLVAAIFSHQGHRLWSKIGDFGSVLMILAVVSLPIIAMGLLVAWPLAFLVILQNVARGYSNPFLGHFLHRYLDSSNRATVVSIKSAVRGLAEFVVLGLFGLLLRLVDLPAGLVILGTASLIAAAWLIVSYCRIFVIQNN